jgi:hypothetical protein
VYAQDVHRVEFALVSGKVADGPDVVRVTRGDRVELVWRSDQAAEIHLHGYDIHMTVGPGAQASVVIHANVTGRFPISLHVEGASGHHRPLTYLEVRPE